MESMHLDGGRINQPYQQVRALCALMAHEDRQAILIELASGPIDVGTLSERLGRSISWVSGALKRLSEHDLVRCTKAARRRLYELGANAQVSRQGVKTMIQLSARSGQGGLTILKPPHKAGRRSTATRKKHF